MGVQVCLHIQGDSRGNVNIIVRDIIGHWGKKIYEHVSRSESLTFWSRNYFLNVITPYI